MSISSGDSAALQPWLLDQRDEAVFVVDADYRILYASARAAELCSYAVSDMLGRIGWDVFPDALGTELETQLRAAMTGRERRPLVADYVPLGLRLAARYVPVGDDHIALFFRDEVVEPEAEPCRATGSEPQNSAYRTLADQSADFVFELDTSNVFTYISPAVTPLLGYEPGEMIGKSLIDFMTAEYAQTVPGAFARIAATQTAFAGLENAVYAKSGAVVYLESSGAPTYDAGGNWTGYRGVKRNISAQKWGETLSQDAERKRRRVADTLQGSLLQIPPHVTLPHVEVVTRYEAASQDAPIGGDLFDVYPLHDDKIALVVGDISGKGLEAVTEMTEIKFLLRSYLRESADPEAALSRLNRQLFLRRTVSSGSQSVMVCLSVAVLDTVYGTARFAVAGMESPLLIRARTDAHEATVDMVTVGGLPLGTIPAWQMDTGSIAVSLAPGDLILLCTDGVVEARAKGSNNPSDPVFGTARLLHSVCAAAQSLSTTPPGVSAATICDAVLSAVRQFAGSERRDDTCLLLAQYVPTHPPTVRLPPAPSSDSADTIITRCDADWRYTYISENIERFTGQRRSDLLGKIVWEAFPAFQNTEYERMARQSRRENRPIFADMELAPPGVLYRVSCTPLPSGEMESRTVRLPGENTADLSRELQIVSREREAALREREAAVREREAALRETERSRTFQRRFLTEVLANVTDGRLRLCHTLNDLPTPLPRLEPPFVINTAASLAPLRKRVVVLGEQMGLPADRAYELSLATGEAAMNCVVHAGGGVATLHGCSQTKRLQVRIVDTGAGISEENLHRATLERGFTTAGTLGLGFSLIYSTADRVYLLTGSTGTTLLLEQNAEPVEPQIVR